ncbi:tRNA (guanosine(37)-N1)-methyltransferase TrmD [Candidatus Daviesbacteria bacterium RIFCSPHIGHO2_01_FULL_44_29]|uniref:tRNA (guanine-N(1)-)-methyltransferase n=1 Tax=Candidatus Daviesbacteria bacterium RIFCSPHIGHO2_02_FULL_43_12 TaxID=1797776 RepID=A0A1F5KFJ9_9BACT|nr:MAG: tRNA (guanosine(37)-N1)-methyltransferase TrmD [Candidatus Daviesbacteria bacterium RIFCSPHIGHO2_01_FULL_44_29]OGE38826.1 MAG: tRNA (guanosine(37)-N1)-methyltransferase TrmD [Candidatus Daviesbacteria bacterium RIFCSPHIGHO2_12_FULL_47_45]OGE39723.1 MAG: tRNA (guanosine(37)-N1)-methyltransferase TrmD [Candidatus Daviesbacteria bacterium RIFCSPHIGHO2_02_FULL_43_12]OGE69986.1 MAG: tRNA (guanosine(37)-N1)-methyltransferase TrmD [Candidatus Daviesbacteria bacterium RIFCSPLOWO2_01_FULL_43_15]
MKIFILTLFPEMLAPILKTSILGRAQKKGLVDFQLINIRDFGLGARRIVDARPYGGGAGMILKADVLAAALKSIPKHKMSRVIVTSASGKVFNQQSAREYAKLSELIIVCGHYEGIDQRFIDKFCDEEVSIGDFVLTGGELPALVITDAITRLLPGVLQKTEATIDESFTAGLLEYPHYTRPEIFEDIPTPTVLLSGDHGMVKKWREEKSRQKTKKIRPDLS